MLPSYIWHLLYVPRIDIVCDIILSSWNNCYDLQTMKWLWKRSIRRSRGATVTGERNYIFIGSGRNVVPTTVRQSFEVFLFKIVSHPNTLLKGGCMGGMGCTWDKDLIISTYHTCIWKSNFFMHVSDPLNHTHNTKYRCIMNKCIFNATLPNRTVQLQAQIPFVTNHYDIWLMPFLHISSNTCMSLERDIFNLQSVM